MLHKRVDARINRAGPGGCWLWEGRRDRFGYGRCGNNSQLAHRYVYAALVGPVPEGLTLDHLCMVKLCVNPTHLEPVTQAENTRRSSPSRRWRTHCIHGHEFTEENTYNKPSGGRDCRTCIRDRVTRYSKKKERVA